jgi:hypothetical protein
VASEQVLDMPVRRHVLTSERPLGSAGLIRFLQLDLDTVLSLGPQARDQAGRR